MGSDPDARTNNEDGQLCVGKTMMFAAEEVNAHRHLIRWSLFFEMHDGRTMARRSDVAGQRVSSDDDDGSQK